MGQFCVKLDTIWSSVQYAAFYEQEFLHTEVHLQDLQFVRPSGPRSADLLCCPILSCRVLRSVLPVCYFFLCVAACVHTCERAGMCVYAVCVVWSLQGRCMCLHSCNFMEMAQALCVGNMCTCAWMSIRTHSFCSVSMFWVCLYVCMHWFHAFLHLTLLTEFSDFCFSGR